MHRSMTLAVIWVLLSVVAIIAQENMPVFVTRWNREDGCDSPEHWKRWL